MKDTKTINMAFESFLNEALRIRKNIEDEREFSRGYLKCISDIVKEMSDDNGQKLDDGISDNYMINMMKRSMDMESRANVLDELMPALNKLLGAYKDVGGNKG